MAKAKAKASRSKIDLNGPAAGAAISAAALVFEKVLKGQPEGRGYSMEVSAGMIGRMARQILEGMSEARPSPAAPPAE